MDRVRSISLSSIVIKFTGPLSLWNSQTSFDANFDFDLTMFCLTSRTEDQCAIEDTKYIASKVLAFCNLSRLYMFVIPTNVNILTRIHMIHI